MYAVVNAAGEVVAVGSHAEVVRDANRLGYTDLIADQTLTDEEEARYEEPALQANPLDPVGAAHAAVDNLVITADECLQLTLQQAADRLKPLVPKKKGEVVKQYKSGSLFARTLLGQNYKTAKTHREVASVVMGLSLAPHQLWQENVGDRWGARTFSNRAFNLCVSSTPECRKTCLVFTGQNSADVYNDAIKLARTTWLLEEPVAFGRLLIGFVQWFSRATTGAQIECARPFIRLNVLSDIPWEVVFPDLFAMFPAMQFYDYTKVPGRRERGLPPNYDITFSYSGRNLRECEKELAAGNKVATVFLPPYWSVVSYDTMKEIATFPTRHQAQDYMKKRGLSKEEAYVSGAIPDTWLGYPVVDGDLSDVRPLDPHPCVVGLSYKTPNIRSKAKGGMMSELVQKEAPTAFVVPVQEVNGQLVTALVPGHEPGHANQEESDQQPIGTEFPELFGAEPPPGMS